MTDKCKLFKDRIKKEKRKHILLIYYPKILLVVSLGLQWSSTQNGIKILSYKKMVFVFCKFAINFNEWM